MQASEQILPKDFVTHVTGNETKTGYGFFWWSDIPVGPHASYAAKGLYGQMIQVVPELNLVFVVTANLPSADVKPVLTDLMNGYVLKAVVSNKAIADAPEKLQACAANWIAPKAIGLPPARGFPPSVCRWPRKNGSLACGRFGIFCMLLVSAWRLSGAMRGFAVVLAPRATRL